MKTRAPERYDEDGQRVGDEPKLSAHEILEQHVSNVSPATAKAIRNAIAEHKRLQEAFDEKGPASMQGNQDASLAALKLVSELRCVAEVLDVLSRASQTAAGAVNQVLEQAKAWPRQDTRSTNGTSSK